MLAGWILMDYWNFELNEDDIAQLAPIGKVVFGEAQEPYFVERMVFDWGNFARNLGEDFDTNIYDYQKMILGEAIAARNLTGPVNKEAQPDQWWWWRLPPQYGQEFRADLVKWGILLS